MAVDPSSFNSVSILASTLATFSSLSERASFAYFDSSFHQQYVSSSISFEATYKVLRPSFAYYTTNSSVLLIISFCPGASSSLMTESAPFEIKIFLPICLAVKGSVPSTCQKILLYLFLVLVNSQIFNKWKYLYSFSGVSIVNTSEVFIPLKTYPNYLAALTKASSSGDDEVYSYFFRSQITVWQVAKAIKTSISESLFGLSGQRFLLSFGSVKLTFGSQCSLSGGVDPRPYDS